MTRRFEKVAIVGVGLLGGSLGLALRTRGLAAALARVRDAVAEGRAGDLEAFFQAGAKARREVLGE